MNVAMAHEKVVIIIVNYRTSDLMPKLLSSIKEDQVDVSVLILDNASTPETYKPLEQLSDPRVHLIKSEKNLGFAGGVNYAFKYALEHLPPFHYLFLFNPDAVSSPNLISNLAEVLRLDKNAAGISPKVLYLNGHPWYSGAQINYKKGAVYNNGIVEEDTEREYHEVDVFSGCAVLFDVEKVRKAGALNEGLFMYYDEADYSMRLHKHGYKILYTPHLSVYHDVSYTTRNISYLKTYYKTRNKFIVFGDNMSTYSKIYFMLHEFALHLKKRRFKNAYYHLRGYLDYKKGKLGQFVNM
jgi:GT2 family glycosyltransferase